MELERLLTDEERTLAYKKYLGMPEEHGLCFCIDQDAKTLRDIDAAIKNYFKDNPWMTEDDWQVIRGKL